MRRAIEVDPGRRDDTDLALTPVTDDALDTLERFQVSEATRAALAAGE